MNDDQEDETPDLVERHANSMAIVIDLETAVQELKKELFTDDALILPFDAEEEGSQVWQDLKNKLGTWPEDKHKKFGDAVRQFLKDHNF